MEAGDSVPVLLYRTSRPQGKVRRRVLDLRIPSTSRSSALPPARGKTLDLSHNESARLAADCLLSSGLEGYGKVLEAEGEVDFLSELDKRFILENGSDAATEDPGEADDVDSSGVESPSTGSLSPNGHAASADTELTLTEMKQSGRKGSPDEKAIKPSDADVDRSTIQVFFPSDSRVAGMKDPVRQFIRKAKQALAVVTDSFTDVELLCDLLEASRKRNVSVHLLLDRLNLSLFLSMWQELKLDSRSFPKLCVRSVHGGTYCARTGRKLTGQIAESFIINDWTEALTGSFSFSWLSWQVHRSLAVQFRGSLVVPFHQELNRLYSSSTPVPGFVTYIAAPPQAGPPGSTSHPLQGDKPAVRERKSCQAETIRLWTLENTDEVQTPATGTVPGSRQKAPREPPLVCLKPSVQPGGRPTAQAFPVPKPGSDGVGSQLQVRSKADPQEKNHTSPPQPQTSSLDADAAPKPKVPETKPVSFPARGQQKTTHHLSAGRTDFHPQQKEVGTEGLLPQHRDTYTFGKHFGTRGLWRPSTDFKSKVQLSSDHHNLLSPFSSPQNQVKRSLQFSFHHPRHHAATMQTKTLLLETRAHYNPHPALLQPLQGSEPAAAGRLPRPEAKGLMPGMGAALPLRPTAPPPGLRWSPQHQAPGAGRHSSFSSPRGMGRQEWGPMVAGVGASLGRSRSMTERRSGDFRGAGRRPNRDMS